MMMGTSRSSFEAQSISFACSVRLLSFRLRWGWEGNNALGVCVCWGGRKREERAEWQASTNQARSADGAGPFYRPQELPTQRSCLSLGSQRTSTHAAASTQMCADCVDCMRVLLHLFYTLTTQHPSGPQHASTYSPLAQTTCTHIAPSPRSKLEGLSPQLIPKIC